MKIHKGDEKNMKKMIKKTIIYKYLMWQDKGNTFGSLKENEIKEITGYDLKKEELREILVNDSERYQLVISIKDDAYEEYRDNYISFEEAQELSDKVTTIGLTKPDYNLKKLIPYVYTLIDMSKEYEDEKYLKGLDKKEIEITVKNENASQKNIRIYDSVIEQWNEFCKENKGYKKQDLISQALVEFMTKYRK